jgi:hypothetical protein
LRAILGSDLFNLPAVRVNEDVRSLLKYPRTMLASTFSKIVVLQLRKGADSLTCVADKRERAYCVLYVQRLPY